jgi:hypothetical protein
VATCHGGIGNRAGGGCEIEGQEGREGKGKGGGRGLKECRWSCGYGAVRCGAVRCSLSAVLISGIRHPAASEKTH